MILIFLLQSITVFTPNLLTNKHVLEFEKVVLEKIIYKHNSANNSNYTLDYHYLAVNSI